MGTKKTLVRKLPQLQNKTVRIINFKPNDQPAGALYHSNKILKITNYIKLFNYIFIQIVLARHCLINFRGTVRLANNMHQHSTRHVANNSVILKQSQTQFYGIFSIEYQTASSWNTLQN